jgi:hypothetical protein
MPLSEGSAVVGATTDRLLNKLAYAMANKANDVTTGATGDRFIIIDVSADYEIKYADAANVLEVLGVTATAAELNGAADVSARRIAVADADYAILAVNSGKPHMVANVSADRTFTLPAEADGLDFEFIATVGAADGHDWIFTSGSDTNYFTGAIVHLDTDAGPVAAEVLTIAPDGNSNSKLQINLPQGGTRVRLTCDGTLWTVSGFAVSTAAPAFADQ